MPPKDFYTPIQDLDPDDNKHVLVCLGGDYTASKQSNLPYRGVDSSYSGRWCSAGTVTKDPATNKSKVVATTKDTLCDHYSKDEIKNIPHISTNVAEALKFLSKDKDGFFLMYEQGDVSRNYFSFNFVISTSLSLSILSSPFQDWLGCSC